MIKILIISALIHIIMTGYIVSLCVSINNLWNIITNIGETLDRLDLSSTEKAMIIENITEQVKDI